MEPSARAALYQTIGDSEIRLLRILQSTDDGTVLHCHLMTVTFDDSVPDYHALSYEWGPPDPYRINSVLVNSHRVITTVNLWLALNHLPKNQYYWIDFLCVNQGDLDERASQVSMMTRIYNMATTVEVWLGLEDDLNRKGLKLLRQYERLELRLDHRRRRATALWHPSKHSLWEGLCHILENTYWTRTWIIQEMIVAKSAEGALLRIGNQCGRLWNLSMLFLDAKLIDQKLTVNQLDAILPDDRPMLLIARRLQALHVIPSRIAFQWRAWNKQHWSSVSHLDLTFLLYCYAKQKCTDPRDRVYALLGIAAKCNSLDLEVNYKISVEQVYINTASYLVQVSGTLNVLTLVQQDNVGNRSLPTWVPDWRMYNSTNQIVYILKKDWDCSADMTASYRFSSCGRSLFAIGMKIGTINLLEPRILARDQELYSADQEWYCDSFQDFFFDRLNFARSILETSSDGSSTGLPAEATITTFYEVNFMLYRNAAELQKSIPFPAFQKFCQELSHTSRIQSPYYVANILRRPNQMFQMTISHNRAATDSNQMPSASNATFDRNTIGLGPLATQLGDIVVVVGGCKHPILLRKVPQGFQVVGEIVVASFMDGQACGRFDLEEFELI